MGNIPSEFWWFVVIGTGIIVGFLVAFVSSLVLSNRVIKEEKDFTQSIMKTTTALMLVLDNNGIIRKFNEALENLTGYTSSEMEGQKFCNTDLFKKNPSLQKLLVAENLIKEKTDTVLLRKNGNKRFVEWTNNFFEGISEKKSWRIWTGADVTQLIKTQTILEEMNKTLELRVEEQTEELRSLIEQSPFAIIIFNPDGQFERCNNVFENSLIGEKELKKLSEYNYLDNPFLTEEELICDSKNIFMHGGNFISKKINVDEELNFSGFNNKIKWIVVRFYGVQDKNKNVFKVACLIEDVTKQKMVEEAYLQLKEEKIKYAAILDTLEQERQRISEELHDGVQQILTSAKIKLDTFELSTGIENKFITESSDLLIKIAEEIRRIIRDLHPQDIDKYGLILSVENLINDLSSIKNINVKFENSFEGNINKVYHVPIYRILQEGVGNIIKHSECKNCKLIISGDEKEIEIILADDGKGFNKNNKFSNLGYGLINMKKRAEFIGGKLEILSELNKGTTLNLKIPLENYE